MLYAHSIITYVVRMAPTVSPPSQTTGTPEITPSPHSSTSSISQGTQTHKNQLKITFYTSSFMSEYVARASVESCCLLSLFMYLLSTLLW